MLEMSKFAKHHIQEEPELDDEDFADKRIWSIAHFLGQPQRDREPQHEGAGADSQVHVTSSPWSMSKSNPLLYPRVLNAVGKHAELRVLVVQQGGSKALIPLVLDGTDKDTRCAASALARIGITQDPAIAFPGQRSRDVMRSISLLLEV